MFPIRAEPIMATETLQLECLEDVPQLRWRVRADRAAEAVELRLVDVVLAGGVRLTVCSEVRGLWSFGDWKLDAADGSLLDGAGTVVHLSAAEYRLLLILLQHPRRSFDRHQLAGLMRASGGMPARRSVDFIASRLRRRLGDDPDAPRYLQIGSEGYMFCQSLKPPAGHVHG